MLDYKVICENVCRIARMAGEYIDSQREQFSVSDIEYKGANDMVTYVDKQTEILVVNHLKELLPDSGFITEEGTAHSNNERFRWVIDPIDGTTNFIHGIPPFCVSIALMDGDEVVVGVVYEVTLREMFYAWKGSKAYLNSREIKVSSIDTLSKALVGIGFSYPNAIDTGTRMEVVEYLQRNSDGVRRLGSATADLVYVACGRFDAFSQPRLAPWDVAAGVLIAQQAGARVTDFSGGNNYIFGKEVIACVPAIYDEYVRIINSK